MRITRTLLLSLLLANTANALTPGQLMERLSSGDPTTLIDVRTQPEFDTGTLPNAMRMSAREAAEKPLPGQVVFFDDGLGVNRARLAAAEFNARANPGVQAVALRGGLAAWAAVQGQTTEPGGMRPERFRYVTYQDLTGKMVADAGDIVLLDVRVAVVPPPAQPDGAVGPLEAGSRGSGPAPALDLAAEFPGYQVTRTLPGAAGASRPLQAAEAADDPAPLYILIDKGDGSAERTARLLRQSGQHRIAVLAGGESIVRRRGVPGSIRRGPGAGLTDEIVKRSPNQAVIVAEEDLP